MRVQVLGRVRAWRDGTEINLGGPKQRAVLALLATAPGQVVARAELVAALWEGDPPPTSVNMVQTYVKQLRRLLEPGRRPRAPSQVLRSVGAGYALHLPPGSLDLARFRELVQSAGRAQADGDPRRAVQLLAGAVALWQGPPLADLPMLANLPQVVALAGERWAAIARYGETMIGLGAATDVLPLLYQAATVRPLDEAAQARLIRAYHAAGQREHAFMTYHAARRRLADELGIDPGPELLSAHAAALATDRGVAHAAGPPPLPASPLTPPTLPTPLLTPPTLTAPPLTPETLTPAVPRQLPASPGSFTGRAEQLHRLDKLLAGVSTASGVISTIIGPRGIGKTSLALHCAHQVAERFPDGQLFANLRGSEPGHQPTEPAVALRGFLDALAVPPARVPGSLDAQVGLYRSLLAGRRMLILLDDARSSDQVRPILPGGPGCLVLVTSRRQLTGLVADGAEPVTLHPLPRSDSRRLLERRIGTERLTAEPAAVDKLLDRCAGLPLALALAAARAAIHPEQPLSRLVEQLPTELEAID